MSKWLPIVSPAVRHSGALSGVGGVVEGSLRVGWQLLGFRGLVGQGAMEMRTAGRREAGSLLIHLWI